MVMDMAVVPTDAAVSFISLDPWNILFLIILGFLGGTLSGFIGSGGAFVLTPGMMSLGVQGAVAVASNMCHKFPKAMIGAWKRSKVGHVDLKLGLITALSAVAGVQIGIEVQEIIADALGPAGTNLYVSVTFLVVLPTVSYFLIRDVIKARKGGLDDTTSQLASKAQKIHVPPMFSFKTAKSTISGWLLVPLGFATGFLAATIAVGGFIGVPSLIYIVGAPSFVASGTELVIAFIMGLTGSFRWCLLGFVDIRLSLLILFGSLFGVQLGAIGTTYVKPYMVKLVMASVMLLVTVSRGVAIFPYLDELDWISLSPGAVSKFEDAGFVILCFAIILAGAMILTPMFKKRSSMKREGTLVTHEQVNARHNLVRRTVLFGALSIGSYILLFMNQQQVMDFFTSGALAAAVTIIVTAIYFSLIHGAFAHCILEWVNIEPLEEPLEGQEQEKISKPKVDTMLYHEVR